MIHSHSDSFHLTWNVKYRQHLGELLEGLNKWGELSFSLHRCNSIDYSSALSRTSADLLQHKWEQNIGPVALIIVSLSKPANSSKSLQDSLRRLSHVSHQEGRIPPLLQGRSQDPSCTQSWQIPKELWDAQTIWIEALYLSRFDLRYGTLAPYQHLSPLEPPCMTLL